MSSRKDGEADDVNVFLDGGIDDLLRGLPQSGEDYLHAGIPQPVSHHFGAPVVPVQTGFAHQHLDFSSCIHPSSSLNEIIRILIGVDTRRKRIPFPWGLLFPY